MQNALETQVSDFIGLMHSLAKFLNSYRSCGQGTEEFDRSKIEELQRRHDAELDEKVNAAVAKEGGPIGREEYDALEKEARTKYWRAIVETFAVPFHHRLDVLSNLLPFFDCTPDNLVCHNISHYGLVLSIIDNLPEFPRSTPRENSLAEKAEIIASYRSQAITPGEAMNDITRLPDWIDMMIGLYESHPEVCRVGEAEAWQVFGTLLRDMKDTTENILAVREQIRQAVGWSPKPAVILQESVAKPLNGPCS